MVLETVSVIVTDLLWCFPLSPSYRRHPDTPPVTGKSHFCTYKKGNKNYGLGK